MCLILDQLQEYVPVRTVNKEIILPDGEIYTREEDVFFKVLIGGDQVTVTRDRSAITIRQTHDTNKEKLRGVIPVIERKDDTNASTNL